MNSITRLFFLTAVFLLRCGFEPGITVTGNSQDVTTVSGIIYGPDLQPAYNVLIVIRSSDYLPEIDQLGKRRSKNGFFVCSTYTDTTGWYKFKKRDSIPEGLFTIEARDSCNNCVLIGNMKIDSLLYFNNIDNKHSFEFRDTLKSPVTINGKIQLDADTLSGLVLAYGLDNFTLINHDGTFRLENLPPGNIRLYINSALKENYQKGDMIVLSDTGNTNELGTLYKIIYDGNGNTGGTIPPDNKWYKTGDTAYIFDNGGNFVKEGHIFTGWNTKMDGNGYICKAGGILILDSTTIVLYAQWQESKHLLTITSSGNGLVSESDSLFNGISYVISAAPDSGYRFSEWRIIKGNVSITNSKNDSTTVILYDENATIEGIFVQNYFHKTYYDLRVFSVNQLNDTGYSIIGERGGRIVWIEADSNGDSLWTKDFATPHSASPSSFQPTTDGGYICIGSTGYGETVAVYLMKINSVGNMTWYKQLETTNTSWNYTINQTNDGGYIAIRSPDSYLIKMNEIGNVQWTKKCDDSLWFSANSIQQTIDGGYIILGDSPESIGCCNIYLVKIDVNGNKEWSRSFGGDGSDWAISVLQTRDGGYIVTGTLETTATLNNHDVYVIRTDAHGDTLWTKTFGSFSRDVGRSVVQNEDGGFFIGAVTEPTSRTADLYFIKLDGNGNMVWTRTFGENEPDYLFSLQRSYDGGYVIVWSAQIPTVDGYIDLHFIKTDEYGNFD